MLCSLKFHYLDFYAVKLAFSESLWIISPVFCSSPFLPSTLLTFYHFLRSSHIYQSLCNPCLSCPLSTFAPNPITVSNTNVLIMFRCTFTFPIPHSIPTRYLPQIFSPSFVEHINYQFSILVFPFGTSQFSSIQWKFFHPVSCCHSKYPLLAASA